MAKKAQKKRTTKKKAGTHLPHVSMRVAVVAMYVLVGVGVMYFGTSVYLDVAYAERVFPGVLVGDVDFTGTTHEEAQNIFQARIAEVEAQGIRIAHQDTEAIIASTVAPKSEIDTAFPLFTYNSEITLEKLFSHGRNNNGLVNSWNRIIALLSPKRVTAELEFDSVRFQEVLASEFASFETPAVNADLTFSEESFQVASAKLGEVFPYTEYTQNIYQQLVILQEPSIGLLLVQDFPSISDQDVSGLITQARAAYDASPFQLTWEDKTWEITKEDVSKSLTVSAESGMPTVVFSEAGLDRVVQEVKSVIDIEPKNARFTIKDGKVSEFQDSRVGRTVDMASLLGTLNERVVTLAKDPITLSVVDMEPEVSESEADDLGITELVARASTNFAGSPTNRRKNIANGVRLINGTLIKPGETFSLVKALSPIEVSNGFFSELVIKGNRTIPEVGGGLCQVSTTLFRSAMVAGLPIVERRNHSYRVSYYEPPVGMDATIYDPAPDFKFTNDYDNYLLLTGFVEGNDITFEFWGTKDGRIANTTQPRMYNITSPGPTQYIESDDVAPGEQKCIERAHNGATADFTYTVTYADGETKEETFVSKYRAWQAVCLVGKQPEGA